jgi:tetratricopeptide (TPR) repeat protein
MEREEIEADYSSESMIESLIGGGIYRGKYRVLKPLAQGGTAQIWLLKDIMLEREAVLKRGRTDLGISKDRLQQLFAQEAAILERLGGGCAPVLFSYEANVPELLMSRASGQPLADLLDSWAAQPERIPPDLALVRFAIALAGAVETCHAKQVVLTDLKPGNVVVDSIKRQDAAIQKPRQGHAVDDANVFVVTLIDFGCSALRDVSNGTPGEDYSPGYGAPELFDRLPVTPASDVYSLGAVLYALFRRRQPGLDHAIRDFGERRTQVLPRLQQLIMSMTSKAPVARPSLAQVHETLNRCAAELEDAANPVVGKCPKCQAPVRSRETKHCPACGEPVKRQTRVMPGELTNGLSATERMFQAQRDGRIAEALYYAKTAWSRGQLSAAGRVAALELALAVTEELTFADHLVVGLNPDCLPDAARQRYLVVLGHYFIRRKRTCDLVAYLEWYRDATKRWPNEEQLWVWLALAGPAHERAAVLHQGLRNHPKSPRLWKALGELMCASDAPADGLTAFMQAVLHGERAIGFLVLVRRLALELQEARRCAGVNDIVPMLTGFLRQQQPKNVGEVFEMIEAARDDREDARWLLELVETGLRLDPYNTDLRAYKAHGLFEQRKYELVIQFLSESALSPVTMGLLGRAHFELQQWDKAASMFSQLLSQNSVPVYWFFLVRCLTRLNQPNEARAKLREAKQRHPDDANLKRLDESMRVTN